MKFGSVCSGIEAASVAWKPLGWEAAWLSEIEPFPCAVLKHHYPDVPNLGDMTTLPERILSGEVEAPDVFCGGTPCQAFSVAGLRNSLDDSRGNLSLTFVGIANAIDHVRSVRSDAPAIIFWENVPGVLSTKDNAFGCFLGALAGESDPVTCPDGKWSSAGVVVGQTRTVAWRVLDAQYFGVAQRRRRVFVVASARADFDPAKVLFEFNGVRRDTAPSRETGQRIAPCVTNGPPFSRTGNERVEAEAMVVAQPSFAIQGSMIGRNDNAGPQGDGINVEVCFTQNTIDRHAVAQPIDFRNLRFHEGDVAGTMQSKSSGGYSLNYETGVMQPIPLDMRNAGRDPEKHDEMNRQGVGVGKPGDPAHTVTSAFVHAVAQPIALQDITPREKAQNGKGWNDDGTAYTVDTHATQGVAQPMAFQQTADCLTAAYGTKWNGNASATNGSLFAAQPIGIFQDSEFGVAKYDSAGTLRAGRIPEHQMVMQPIAWDEELNPFVDIAGTLLRGGAGGRHDGVAQPMVWDTTNITSPQNGSNPKHDDPCFTLAKGQHPPLLTSMAVRRLTPVECERLQGFPDGYTNIPWRKKPESPDGPRYKALGNSWAVPVVRWIGKRIQEAV
jgi:DNA (cytosine-5)-methyltransferase 1